MKTKINYTEYIRRYEIIIVSVIILLFTLVMTLIFLIPNFNKARNIYNDQLKFKKRLENLLKKENDLSYIDEKYYKDNFPKIDIVLPQSKDYVSLFSTFDNLEQKDNVKVLRTDFQFGIISTDTGKLVRDPVSSAYAIPIHVNVSGDMASVRNFISQLTDYSGRFMIIENIQWKSEGEGNASLTFEGKAYYYPLTQSLGNIEAPIPKMNPIQDKILKKISQISLNTQEEDILSQDKIGKKDLFQ